MYITPVNNVIYFRAKTTDEDRDKKKVTPQDAAVATGAAGATGSAIASKGTFKSFSQANKKLNTTAKNLKTGLETATDVSKKAHGILGKFKANCLHFKEKFIDFGKGVSNSNLLKPILESKAYKGAATVAGGATAGIVAISGIGEMFNTFAKKAQQFSTDNDD